jgi:hypothetical protein
MKNIPSSICHAIFDILVMHAGAAPDSRGSFVYYYSNSEERPSEFRIGGKFGLAGKFWWNNDRFYVSGSSRGDMSFGTIDQKGLDAEAEEADRINALLAPLYEQFHNYRMAVGMMETIPAYPQSQSSLEAQLRILIPVANRLGLQDAADFLVRRLEG